MKFVHAFCLASIFVASQSYARVVVTVNTTNDENGENLANAHYVKRYTLSIPIIHLEDVPLVKFMAQISSL